MSLNLINNGYTFIPVALLIIQIAAFYFRELSIKRYSFGERVRRLAMLKDGLDVRISDIECKRLLKGMKDSNIKEPPYIGHYYDSELPKGPARLLDILTESCFYTESIAHQSFKILIAISSLSIFGIIIIILIVANAYTNQLLFNIVLVSLPLLSFWAAGDIVNMALRFMDLHKSCSYILLKCDELQKSNSIIIDEIMCLVDEYNCALSASLPLPTKFYKADQEELNNLWSASSKDDGV